MKMTIAIVVAIFGLYLIIFPSWSVEEPDLPFGVTSEEWVAISENVGLVVEVKKWFPFTVEVEGQTMPHPRAEAVLMAKIHGQWAVIDWPTKPERFEFKPLEK